MVNKKPERKQGSKGGGCAAPLPSPAAIPLCELEYDLRDLAAISAAMTRINRRLVKVEAFMQSMQQQAADDTPPPLVDKPLTDMENKMVRYFIEKRIQDEMRKAASNDEV